MIKLKIPLKKFAEVNTTAKCKGLTVICKTTHDSGILDHIDILGICRRKDKTEITTTHQAYIVLKINSTKKLIEAIEIYKPTEIWF